MFELWWVVFGLIVVLALIIQLRMRQLRYVLMLLAGMVFGFYFDFVSVTQGYYLYYPYWPTVLGIPLTVTLAEGCAVTIVLYVFEMVKNAVVEKRVRFL